MSVVSRKPHHPLLLTFVGDSAKKSSLVLLHFLSDSQLDCRTESVNLSFLTKVVLMSKDEMMMRCLRVVNNVPERMNKTFSTHND